MHKGGVNTKGILREKDPQLKACAKDIGNNVNRCQQLVWVEQCALIWTEHMKGRRSSN